VGRVSQVNLTSIISIVNLTSIISIVNIKYSKY
jgi:hypothetical protein